MTTQDTARSALEMKYGAKADAIIADVETIALAAGGKLATGYGHGGEDWWQYRGDDDTHECTLIALWRKVDGADDGE